MKLEIQLVLLAQAILQVLLAYPPVAVIGFRSLQLAIVYPLLYRLARDAERDFKALVSGRELWATSPTESELGEMVLREFGDVLRFMDAEGVAQLPVTEQPMYLTFPCHEAATDIDAAFEAWFTARDATRPEWA